MKIGLISLGCSKNLVDSENILGFLINKRGFELVEDLETADIVVVNTCAFIGDAKEESIEAILEAAEYKNQGNSYRIMYKDILYFQSDGRKINIVMEKKIESFYGKLSEIEQMCPEGLFLRIHKSYLINMCHAKEITYKWIKMINGDVLDISRSNRVAIRRKLMESMANEIRNDS
jgi:DNA-binding LytR/AlgR family response regulator